MRRLVVLAWGNESRGDDGLGPAFLAHSEALADPPGVATTFVTDFQLQPEHAIDLDGRDLALFVDASLAAAAPFAFRRLEAARTATFSTHGVPPGVVLDAFAATFGRAAPPAYELAIHGETFALGTPLGAGVARTSSRRSSFSRNCGGPDGSRMAPVGRRAGLARGRCSGAALRAAA